MGDLRAAAEIWKCRAFVRALARSSTRATEWSARPGRARYALHCPLRNGNATDRRFWMNGEIVAGRVHAQIRAGADFYYRPLLSSRRVSRDSPREVGREARRADTS